MDLSSLSLFELRDLQQQIPTELKRREAQEKADALKELQAFAKARGFTLEELLGKDAAVAKVKTTSGNKVKVKYRHPENPEFEWTGRGRKPKWFEQCLADGISIEALTV